MEVARSDNLLDGTELPRLKRTQGHIQSDGYLGNSITNSWLIFPLY